ncbi:hypothetical protein BB559_007197 [Furculomyces boomerangus]|nr:hypothetical protein BB559_007197 [Furculomyces boomerangus]
MNNNVRRQQEKESRAIPPSDLLNYPQVLFKDLKLHYSTSNTQSQAPASPDTCIVDINRERYQSTSVNIPMVSDKHKENRLSTDTSSTEVECLICFEEIEENDIIRTIPCQHVFHSNCLDTWLLEQAAFCPTCRLDLRISKKTSTDSQLT